MADSTIPATPKGHFSFSQAALACGKKVGLGLVVIVGVSAAVGKGIEERAVLLNAIEAGWAGMLWLFSMGGHLWGSVAVGMTALAVLGWAWCVHRQLPERGADKAESVLFWAGSLATVVWVMATVAMQKTFVDFDHLFIYEQIAVVVRAYPQFCVRGIS